MTEFDAEKTLKKIALYKEIGFPDFEVAALRYFCKKIEESGDVDPCVLEKRAAEKILKKWKIRLEKFNRALKRR